MKKTLATILSLCLILSCTTFTAMAADYTLLIEECLTTEVSSAITKNLTLPTTWDGAAITWESSDETVISDNGVVTRGASDKTVTLTAKADGAAVKTLTFTVIGKGKKVWASENFYRPSSVGEEFATSSTVLENPADQFVESVEGAVGHAGFANFETDSYTSNKISLEANPEKTGDYAMRLYLDHSAATADHDVSYGGFVLPGTDLPTGKVTIQMTLTRPAPSINKDEWRIGVGDSFPEKTVMLRFGYNKNSTIDGNEAGTNIVKDLNASSNGNLSTRVTLELDYDKDKYKVTNTSHGTLVENETDFPSGVGESLKQINFTNRNGAADSELFTAALYVDDIVITTDEIDGATAQERAEIYKSLLEDELADKTFVNADFDLDLLPAFNETYSVAWESSDNSLIAVDNATKMADVRFTEVPENVTLTGTITHGDATATITKEICVAAPDVTIKSETSEGVTGIVDYENFTGDYNKETNAIYRHGQYFPKNYTAANPVLNGVVDANGNNYIHFEESNLKWGRISDEATIKSLGYKILSVDIMYEKPEDGTRILPSVMLNLGNGTSAAILNFSYTASENGFVEKKMYATLTEGEVAYVSDEIVPDVDEWFNLKIVTYDNNSVYDVYINNERVFEKAVPYYASATNTAFHNVSFTTISTNEEIAPAAANIDNIALYGAATSTAWAVAASDLALASIDSANDTLAVSKNDTRINWTATGDVGIDGASLTKSKSYGIGKGVVTASAVATDGTAVTRSHNVWYGTGINKVNANETTLETISYTTDYEAKGFVGLYNASKELLDVKIFNLTSGNGNLAAFNEALPATFDSYKVFVWDGATLKPLADPFED